MTGLQTAYPGQQSDSGNSTAPWIFAGVVGGLAAIGGTTALLYHSGDKKKPGVLGSDSIARTAGSPTIQSAIGATASSSDGISSEDSRKPLQWLAQANPEQLDAMIRNSEFYGSGVSAKVYSHHRMPGVLFRVRKSMKWKFDNEASPAMKYVPVVYREGKLKGLDREQHLGLPVGALIDAASNLTEIPASEVLVPERKESNYAKSPTYTIKYSVLRECEGRALNAEYGRELSILYDKKANPYYERLVGRKPHETLSAFADRVDDDVKYGRTVKPEAEKIAAAYRKAVRGMNLSIRKNSEISQSAFNDAVALLQRNGNLNFDFSNAFNAKIHPTSGAIQFFDFCAGENDAKDYGRPYSKANDFGRFAQMMMCENHAFGIHKLSEKDKTAIRPHVLAILAKIEHAMKHHDIPDEHGRISGLIADWKATPITYERKAAAERTLISR